ncbi:hypothetical protein RTE01_45310 [Raoultella terrigena]|nr:hypothetical protein RTE01_45310 [Raoultella terrigena]
MALFHIPDKWLSEYISIFDIKYNHDQYYGHQGVSQMVQDPPSLAPFFRNFAQKNNENNAEQGSGYRETVGRV